MGERDIQDVAENSVEQTEEQDLAAKSLESPRSDKLSGSPPVDTVLAQSTSVIGDRKPNHLGSLIMLLLLFCFLFGAGYYYLNTIAAVRLPAPQINRYVSPMIPVPARPQPDLVVAAVAADPAGTTPPVTTVADSAVTPPTADHVVPASSPAAVPVFVPAPVFTVTVGPLIDDADLQHANRLFADLGLQPQKKAGSGPVTMIRLLEGIYPAAEARKHLATLEKIDKSAFLLPSGDKLAVYAGSFRQQSWAQEMQDDLALKMVDVSLVKSEITMTGTLLTVPGVDQSTANQLAARLSSLGLHTRLVKKK